MLKMERLEKDGIRSYDKVTKHLKSQTGAIEFSTPTHRVVVSGTAWLHDKRCSFDKSLDDSIDQADGVLFVVSQDAIESIEAELQVLTAAHPAQRIVVLVNKMWDCTHHCQ